MLSRSTMVGLCIRQLPFEALRRVSVASQLELYQFLPGSAAGVALWAPGGALAPSAAGYPGLPLVCLC